MEFLHGGGADDEAVGEDAAGQGAAYGFGLAMNSGGTGSGALERVRVSGGCRMWKLTSRLAYSSRRHLASDSSAPFVEA